MCSILCWILSIWEALGCIFFAFLAWFMHCQQGGEVWAWIGLLGAFRRFSGGFESFLGSCVHRSDRSRSPVWPVSVLALFICWAPVWPVVVTGLTGQSWADAAVLFSSSGCIHSSRGSCIGSGGACMCPGGALYGLSSFGLVVCALCLSFVLSRMCRVVTIA
jgi:hypothetical protein